MSRVKIDKSKDNYNILKINRDGKEIYLGSRYNQKRDIDNFIKGFGAFTENDNYVIMGIGALEHIKELISKKNENSNILIIEADNDIKDEVIKMDGSKELLEREDVYLVEELHDIETFFKENLFGNNIDFIKINSFGNYNKIYSEELVPYYRVLKDCIINEQFNKNTNLAFTKDWFEGLINHIKYLHKSVRIDEYKDKFKGRPAVIVSAGPSLNKNINDLDSNKAYIISGGRTLKSLLKIGIDPDFTVVVDGSDASFELVDGYIDKTDSKLLYTEMTNKDVVKYHKGNKIVSSMEGFIRKIYDDNIQNCIYGGSVANAMTYFAAYMGCSPVIFIGQDLAYTNGKGHAECANSPGKGVDGKDYYSDNDVYLKGIDGEEIRSSLSLKSFKEALERIICMFEDTEFINATEGGAHIEGTKVMALKDVLSKLPEIKKEDDTEFKEDLDIKKKVKDSIKLNIRAVKKCISLCSEGEELLKRFKISYKTGKGDMKGINNKLTKIENDLSNEIKNATLLNSWIYELSFNLDNKEEFVVLTTDSENDIVDKRLLKNTSIYEGIRKLCEENLDSIIKSYNELI